MNNAAPKLQPLKASQPKTMGTQGQGIKPPKQASVLPANKQQTGNAPPGGNSELVLIPSKTNPAIKRWQNPHEEQPEPKQPKAPDQPTGKAPKQADRPDFKVGDRIAFQTKDQHGSSDFTYGKIQEESDTFYGVIDDNGDKHSLPKQAARTPKQATESKAQEKEAAQKEGREVKTSRGSKEVDIKAGDRVEKGLLLENGDLWQAVNVGSYVDYVKLGNVYNNATVAMKVGSHLGVVNEDGKSDVIHKSDVINVGKGTNREQVDEFNKRLAKHLKRLEKKLDKLHLDNQSLRKRIKQVAAKKGTTPEAEEKLNQQIVKEREKRKAVEQKLHDLTIKHALKEERRLRDLASLQEQLREQKKAKVTTEKTATEEKKTKLDRIINKYESQIKDLEDRLEFQAKMQRIDTYDKEKLIDIETGRVDYKKQLKEFQNEMQNLIHQDYDYALEMMNEKKVKKAKYDFSALDFHSIDAQHAIDVMSANLPDNPRKNKKSLRSEYVDECKELFASNPGAYFQRMLNNAKRIYPDSDDLTALQKRFGSNWMLSAPTDEDWVGRVQVLQEGDENIYDAFGPDDNEIEKELESRNQPVINRAIEDLGLDDKKLAEVKAGSPEYDKLVDKMTGLLLAHGQTRAELASEYMKPRALEGEQPEADRPETAQEAPEALYDPEEPYYPQSSDYDSLQWHDDDANEYMDLMSKDEGEFFHNLERDEQGNFKPEFLSMLEDSEEITGDDLREMEPILNAVYAESNNGYEQERVAQAHSEVMATAQIISDRIIKKAGMKNKAQAEVEKLKEKVSTKEREFLDKYLYGIKKAFTWFGRLITMRKSQQALTLDAPAKMPHYVRAVVSRKPLHHIEHSGKALLPSPKNPLVDRWQLIDKKEKKGKTLNLFDQPEKKEVEKPTDDEIARNPFLLTKEQYGKYPRSFQWMFARIFGIKENVRERTVQQEKIAHKLRTTPGGAGGDAAPDKFFADGRDLHKEIVEKAIDEGKKVPKEVLADYPELQKKQQKLYHGTTENFRQLDSSKAGTHIPDFMSLLGTHYTPNKEVAQQFAGKQGKVIESDFKPKKPFKTTESDLVRKIATFGVENGMIDLDRAKESAEFRDVKAKLGSKQDLLKFINKAGYEDLRRVIYPQIDRKQGQKIVDAYAARHLKDYDSIQYLNEVEKPEEKRYDWIELKKSVDLIKGYRIPKKYEFQGLPISIETPKGKTRSGVDPDGNEWETTMKYDYGYIRQTEGVDNGDKIDCYVGPDKKSDTVYIVHQNNPDTQKYDEDKVFLGFNSADQVKKVFLQHYDDPGFWGSMTQMPMKDFKKFLDKKKNKGEPVAFDPKNVAQKAVMFHGKKYILKSTVQFKGESPYDAIINHHGLDIVEEAEFIDFFTKKGLNKESSLKELESALKQWRKKAA